MATRQKNTAAPRRAADPSPTRKFLTPKTALAAAALVGISATAAIIPNLTLSAVAANNETTVTTPGPAVPGTLDAFSAREQSVSRDTTRPEIDPADTAKARSENLVETSEQITTSQQEAALASRNSSFNNQGKAIKAEEKRIKMERDRTFFWPTAGGVSSWWGPRLHPILRYTRLHGGLDIGGACGQPIWAAHSGTVTSVASSSASGNNVRIDHGMRDGKRLESSYLHMDTFAVKQGQKVTKGQVIGTVGNTGLSTACHLHFTTYIDGNNVDPVPFLKPGETSKSNRTR